MEFGPGTAHVFPSDETVQALLRSEDPSPIVMMNLLKLQAGGGDALAMYREKAGEALAAVGGSFLYRGSVVRNVIGDADWDAVTLVQYPNQQAFAKMMLGDLYGAAGPHRGAAVARAELLMTAPTLLNIRPA